jgi:tRNA(fMet)-specific endonuclease VapC
MLYTLDTNCVSQILNGQQIPLNHLRKALLAGDDVILNAICYYEIKRGLVLPTFQRKLQIFEQLVRKHGLLNLDKTALDEAIDIYQDLRRKGTPLEDADLLMGAVARANGATLVTHNTRHFQRIVELSLGDWEI